MKEFISKWSNWWILAPKRKQLDEAFEKELNELMEREVALCMHNLVEPSERLTPFYCPNCGNEWDTNKNNACQCGAQVRR